MIMSGWILPDMFEVKCISCDNLCGHKEVVKRYLLKLKERDTERFSEIMKEYFKLRTQKKVLDLEDFAVIKLGWIKVINFPIKIVFYSLESPTEFLVKSYEKIGYSLIPINERASIIYIPIPSQELI